MPFVERPGEPVLHYVIDDFTDPWKDAPVLLLQHGNGRSGRFWYRWVPYLSRFYRVVRPDLRGLGQSGRDFDLATGLTLEALVGDLAALLDRLGTASVHYVGESMGGILGLALAATHPERVRTLTLVATPVSISGGMKERYAMGHGSRVGAMREMGIRPWVEATTRGTRLPADEQPDLFRWYVDEFVANDTNVQLRMSELVNAADASAFLPRVKAPVLGLYPTAGQITDSEQEARLKAGLRNFEMIHLPTPWHMVQLLHPAECARRTLAFCASHDGIAIEEP
ncbi:MAG TPA: alpha/beta hydrolase [Roseomonas sp.]|jgi:3-oxoadipate enol-lactonase